MIVAADTTVPIIYVSITNYMYIISCKATSIYLSIYTYVTCIYFWDDRHLWAWHNLLNCPTNYSTVEWTDIRSFTQPLTAARSVQIRVPSQPVQLPHGVAGHRGCRSKRVPAMLWGVPMRTWLPTLLRLVSLEWATKKSWTNGCPKGDFWFRSSVNSGNGHPWRGVG